MKNVCLLLVLLVLFGGLTSGAVLFSEDFDDGNVDDWTYFEASHEVPDTWGVDVSSGALNIFRYMEPDGWGKVGISKLVDIPVSSDTSIIFDVMTIFSNVVDGTGFNNNEYPAHIRLTLNTSLGEEVLVFSYNYRGGYSEEIASGYRVGVGYAPQGLWLRDETYRIRDYFPTATSISEIRLLGSGWDYESQIDNIQIVVPEPLTIVILLAGVPFLRKRK